MAERLDYLQALVRGNDGKAKATPSESFAPAQPMNVTADASIFEVLLRGASEEEARLMRRLLIEWSRGDENSFPHQLTLITLSQWRAAARVPIETAKVLQQHHDKLEDSATRFVRAADTKLAEYGQVGKLVVRLEREIERLVAAGDEAIKGLKQSTGNFNQAEARFRAQSKIQDVLFFVVVLLFVAMLGFILGIVVCHYSAPRVWPWE